MSRLITKDGLKKLEDELEERTTTVRQEIANAIKEAKEQGDLSENAEYSEAKRQQNDNETRVSELEVMIKEAEVVERDKKDDTVQLGSTVTVKVKGSEIVFEMVGSNEADPEERKISNESPIGKALMGHGKGDTVEVEMPAGAAKYEIVDVN